MKQTRILAVRLGAMGDIIHTLPAVASLKSSFPHSHVAWVIEEKWQYLLEGNPFVDQVFAFNRRSLSSFLKLRKDLQMTKWDMAVDFQGLLKSAAVASLARPERIAGYHHSQARESWAALFYSLNHKATAAHVVDRHLQLAEAAGAHNIVRHFPLPAGVAEGELPAGPFVLASPFAGWKSKQWPLVRYQELAQSLKSNGIELVLNVSASIEITGVRQHVSSLAGLIHATREAIAVVGVDSGPLHLAAALGKSGVAIFGPTDPVRNGPYGNGIKVLRAPGALTTYQRDTEIAASMEFITADQVTASLLPALTCVAGR